MLLMVVLIVYLKTIEFLDHVNITLYLRMALSPQCIRLFAYLIHQYQQRMAPIARHQPQCLRLYYHNKSRIPPSSARAHPMPKKKQMTKTLPTHRPQSCSNIVPMLPSTCSPWHTTLWPFLRQSLDHYPPFPWNVSLRFKLQTSAKVRSTHVH